VLESFPSNDVSRCSRQHRVRYITIQLFFSDMFGPRQERFRGRLQPYAANIMLLAVGRSDDTYEVVRYRREVEAACPRRRARKVGRVRRLRS